MTSQLLHLVWAGSGDASYPVWSDQYDTIKATRSVLDFNPGEVVWEKQVGSGYSIDHFYEAVLLGLEETIYMGV